MKNCNSEKPEIHISKVAVLPKLSPEQIDEVVRKNTAFSSLQDMCDSSMGSYVPTLRIDIDILLKRVADAYDAEMEHRGSEKRAYRVYPKNTLRNWC